MMAGGKELEQLSAELDEFSRADAAKATASNRARGRGRRRARHGGGAAPGGGRRPAPRRRGARRRTSLTCCRARADFAFPPLPIEERAAKVAALGFAIDTAVAESFWATVPAARRPRHGTEIRLAAR